MPKHETMPKHEKKTAGKPRKLRIALIVIACALAVAGVAVAGVLRWRLALARTGAAGIGEPTPIEEVQGATDADGRVSARARYSSVVGVDGQDAEIDVAWDDDWFFADPTVYNQDLARAAIVFSAVANSESAHYQAGSGVPDYMGGLLAQLGFENVSTASYEYRSEVVDQLAAVFQPKGTDVTVFTIASKHITDSRTGAKKLLVMVAVRGSYGTEWLSNLQMSLAPGLDGFEDDGTGDHQGFSDASNDLAAAIFSYIDALREQDPDLGYDDVSLLLCGHSRGGAVTNLTGAYFDMVSDELSAKVRDGGEDAAWLDGSFVHKDSVYAYAFATPETTDSDGCRDAVYDNIFNVLNPADIVPRMPLSAWGYDRYGRDLWLPEDGCEGFDEKYAKVRETFRSNVGCDTKADPADVEDVDQIIADIAAIAPAREDFQTPLGVLKSLGAIVGGHDIVRIVYGHAPDLYSAWLSATDAGDLRASRV